MTASARAYGTMAGVLAILIWGTTVAACRSLTESVGPLTSACLIHLLGGGIPTLLLCFHPKKRQDFCALPGKYLLVGGALFVLYITCFYLALGSAIDRTQALEVGVINYLWPCMTMAFSIPLLGNRARWWMWPGMLLAFSGAGLAMLNGNAFTVSASLERFMLAPQPILIAFICPFSWGLYNNLSRRWAGAEPGNAIPVFIFCCGLSFFLMRLAWPEESVWTPRAILELIYVALMPTFLAYLLWDFAMRRGDLVFVATLSFFIPIISTAMSAFYLRVPLPLSLCLGALMVTLGALLCKFGVREKA